jgi:hypothetical protein
MSREVALSRQHPTDKPYSNLTEGRSQRWEDPAAATALRHHGLHRQSPLRRPSSPTVVALAQNTLMRWPPSAPPTPRLPQLPLVCALTTLPLRPSVVVVDDVLEVDSQELYPTDLLVMILNNNGTGAWVFMSRSRLWGRRIRNQKS